MIESNTQIELGNVLLLEIELGYFLVLEIYLELFKKVCFSDLFSTMEVKNCL